MSSVVRCPKCKSNMVERTRNQEYRCQRCGETFYFVTPQCGDQGNQDRYNL